MPDKRLTNDCFTKDRNQAIIYESFSEARKNLKIIRKIRDQSNSSYFYEFVIARVSRFQGDEMSDLIPKNVNGSLQIKSMDDLSRLSVMLAKSGYFTDSKEAAQCGVKVLAGLEMGFGATAAMSGIHIIKGKPTIGANLMAAAVKRSGKYNYRVKEHSNTICTILFFENGVEIGESSFTLEDAQKAGVGGNDNWRKYPRNMLFSRALSNGVRWFCPDVLIGVAAYTPEEMGANVDEDGDVVNVSFTTPRIEEKPVNGNTMISDEQTFDRSLINAEIESLMRRKNISVEIGRKILFDLFSVKGRQQLSDIQLSQFLDYLKTSNQSYGDQGMQALKKQKFPQHNEIIRQIRSFTKHTTAWVRAKCKYFKGSEPADTQNIWEIAALMLAEHSFNTGLTVSVQKTLNEIINDLKSQGSYEKKLNYCLVRLQHPWIHEK
ncbi:MAG: hypothetical protein AAF915_13965 [Cyanobacteria bacterium P01_D01_bin.50]